MGVSRPADLMITWLAEVPNSDSQDGGCATG